MTETALFLMQCRLRVQRSQRSSTDSQPSPLSRYFSRFSETLILCAVIMRTFSFHSFTLRNIILKLFEPLPPKDVLRCEMLLQLFLTLTSFSSLLLPSPNFLLRIAATKFKSATLFSENAQFKHLYVFNRFSLFNCE